MQCNQCGREMNPKRKTYYIIVDPRGFITYTQCAKPTDIIIGKEYTESKAKEIAALAQKHY